jgi:hypothetical protein
MLSCRLSAIGYRLSAFSFQLNKIAHLLNLFETKFLNLELNEKFIFKNQYSGSSWLKADS